MGKKRKAFLCVLMGMFTCFGAACGGVEIPYSSSSIPNEGTIEETGESWYEERSGYIFCGYFEDENFTKRVTKTVTQATAKNYYAKYQPDKAQLLALSPIDLDWTVYASNFADAVGIYLREICAYYDMDSSLFMQEFYQAHGVPFTMKEVLSDDGDIQGFFNMTDTAETCPMDYKSQWIPRYKVDFGANSTHNNRWQARIGGEEKYTIDGWEYFIVNDSYAVVTGHAIEKNIVKEIPETMAIPSEIEGRPVKEVSILFEPWRMTSTDWNWDKPLLNKLVVPCSVENAVLYVGVNQGIVAENLIIEEGVRTVRLSGHSAKNITIPSTAYYVDFDMYASLVGYVADMNITVNGGEHYFTENGVLYSTEGDFVYQYGERNKLNLYISPKAKRMLPASIMGGVKNIFIPQSMESFAWDAFLYSPRARAFSIENEMVARPLLIVDSPKVAKQFLDDTLYDGGYLCFPLIAYNKNIDLLSYLEASYKDELFELMFDEEDESLTEAEKNEIWQETLAEVRFDCGLEGYWGLWREFQVIDNKVYAEAYTSTGSTEIVLYSYLGDTLPEDEEVLEDLRQNLQDPIIHTFYAAEE